MRTFPARISYPYCWERLPKTGPEGSAWCRTCCSLPIPPYPHGMRSTLWVKEHTIRTTRTVAALAQQRALQTLALQTSSEPVHPPWRWFFPSTGPVTRSGGTCCSLAETFRREIVQQKGKTVRLPTRRVKGLVALEPAQK